MSIMGKVRIIVIVLFLGVIFVLNVGKEEKKVDELQQGIAEQVIRFHVLANSDEAQDQQLKLKVSIKGHLYQRRSGAGHKRQSSNYYGNCQGYFTRAGMQ